jgi:hypothetical protein
VIKFEVIPLSIYQLERMGELDRLINTRRMSGPGYVWLVDGKPLAAAGLGRVVNREYFAWCIVTPEVRASKLLMRRLTKTVRIYYPVARDLLKADVIQADVADFPMHRKWLERLGLIELPVRRYGWAKNG